MRFGIASGFLWGLDTVILGIALTMGAFIGTPEAIAFAAIASAFMHDAACAIWLFLYMGVRRRLGDTLRALKTRSGKVVMLGALLGGPLGMTGYLVAINNIGAGYTAIISAFYPAFGTFMAFVLLKERMRPRQLVALACALAGVMVMGYATSGDSSVGNAALGLVGAVVCVVGWGSEAVLCAWGMRDDAVDNETALHTRVQSMEEELTALRRENETLREPAAQYQSLRDHIAEIEISAHRRTEEFRGKAIAELMQLIEQQRQWCAQQRDAYARMTEGILQELRQAERQVEACDIGNFDRMEESLRQLENTLHTPE